MVFGVVWHFVFEWEWDTAVLSIGDGTPFFDGQSAQMADSGGNLSVKTKGFQHYFCFAGLILHCYLYASSNSVPQ